MTAAEKRQLVAKNHDILVAQKNIYSQDAAKRECAFTKHTDGKNYSDCSSSVRHATERADPGVKPMGGNTVGMYQNKNAIVVDCKIVNGVPTDISKLQVGDCFLFAGTDVNRAYADYVGHVEQVHSIVDNKVMLYGHGSGNPTTAHEMVAYCKNRQNAKTDTKKGNRGLLKVLRFIQDDSASVSTPETTVALTLGARILKYGMSGDDVKELQRGLKALGFFGGSIGGNYLEITQNAVEAFQRKHGLTVDGEFGPKSLEVLNELLAETVAPTVTTDVMLTTTGNVYLRVGPDASYADEGTAKTGSKLAVLTDGNGKPVVVRGWYAVIVNKVVLWASSKYVEE